MRRHGAGGPKVVRLRQLQDAPMEPRVIAGFTVVEVEYGDFIEDVYDRGNRYPGGSLWLHDNILLSLSAMEAQWLGGPLVQLRKPYSDFVTLSPPSWEDYWCSSPPPDAVFAAPSLFLSLSLSHLLSSSLSPRPPFFSPVSLLRLTICLSSSLFPDAVILVTTWRGMAAGEITSL